MTKQEKQQLVDAVITQLKNEGTDVSSATVVKDVNGVSYVLCYDTNGNIVRVSPDTINQQESTNKDAIKANATAIANETQRATEAEGSLGIYISQVEETVNKTNADIAETKKNIASSLHASSVADSVNITGKSDVGKTIFSANIPAATTEKAGVMTAGDKKKVDSAIVLIKSKNIFNADDPDVMLGYMQASGAPVANTSYNLTGYIPVVAGKTYHVGFTTNASPQVRFCTYFSSNKENLSYEQYKTTFTAPANAAFVRLTLSKNYTLANVIVEEGDSYTGYVPYSNKYDLSPDLDFVAKYEKVYPAVSQLVGEITDVMEAADVAWYVGAGTNVKIFDYYTKSDNCTLTCTLKNVVGDYYSVRLLLPSSYNFSYVLMSKRYDNSYFGSKTLTGLPKGSKVQVAVFTDSTHIGSVDENSVVEIQEQSYNGTCRPRVDIYASDTQLEVFNKMQYANNVGHCDVFFQPGTYNFNEELFDWMRIERVSARSELPIGNNCRYYFNGATLIGSYAGEDTHVRSNCNVIGCALTSGNFELHDGTIIANDIIYGVHDDCGSTGAGDQHIHKYHNMHVIYNGGTYAKDVAICKCIGGGTCKNLTVVIDNCVLEKYTENTNKNCVTYHGFSNNPSYQTKARIVITNTWMTGASSAYHIVQESRNETIEFVVSNCRTNVTSSDVDKLITWNNEPIS